MTYSMFSFVMFGFQGSTYVKQDLSPQAMLSVQTEWFSTNKSKKILLISSMYEIKKSSDKATLETENKHLDITKL